MAKQMTPSALRAEAKQMLELANQAEDKQYMKIGRMVEKELNKSGAFTSDDAGELKAEIEGLKGKINKIMEN
jgi:hypothetical protein